QRVTECLLDAVAGGLLGARQAHRRLERSVGQLREAFRHRRDAHVRLDLVVPWLQLVVAERPVDTDAVVRRGLEVDVAHPKTAAPPDVGASADDAGAYPEEAGRRRVDVR